VRECRKPQDTHESPLFLAKVGCGLYFCADRSGQAGASSPPV
jgi:hypothetical protein